ncbi:hypothetical protein [Treponema endosymbiont of Eucomonympha sp.]|uniref:hypothetical protein n=1 Tax=Treponema endosymbiont of Eucomonympha sp. TaxID=1580831 RepID=UPI000780AEF9|nr:hypothetical protein [Treponema endosymbiont of Eucomonympha sp.]
MLCLFAKKITTSNARSVSANKGKLIDAGYPGKLFVRNNGSSRSVDAATGKENLTAYPVDVKIKDLLENADRETLEKLGITSQETVNAYLAQESIKEEKFTRFWAEISKIENDILNFPEEELSQLLEIGIEPMGWLIDAGSDTSEYKLPDWTNIRNWKNPSGYCGPNVIAFIMLGLGTKSGYENIPTTNDVIKLYQFYADVENTIGTGPKYFNSLSDGLENLTKNKYRLYSHWGIFVFDHSWRPIDKHIRKEKLPAVSLRSSKFIDWSSPESAFAWHYRAIIGTKTKTHWVKIFIKIPIWSEHWYYMHDNGTDGPLTDAWWEPEITWYHFQAASVGKK